jgi:predicted DNA-binding protein (UPF0251 family)
MRPKGRSFNKSYRGERIPASKLTADDVRLIDALLAEDLKQSEIARKFEVSRNTINSIALGRTWKHITGIGYHNQSHQDSV